MKAMLEIINCNDPLMWYSGMIGQRVPFIRVLVSENCYMSREPKGYSNIVKMNDARIVYVEES